MISLLGIAGWCVTFFILGAIAHAMWVGWIDELRYREGVAAGVEPSLAAVSPVLAEPQRTECVHCEKSVELDRALRARTGESTYYDAGLLDGTVDGWNDGKSCPAVDGEPHELAATVNA